jgi:hypothetical protein
MCWEIDYEFFAEQKKAQEPRIKQEQRAGVIHQLLNETNMQGDKTNVKGTPIEEVAPAKSRNANSPAGARLLAPHPFGLRLGAIRPKGTDNNLAAVDLILYLVL